MLHRCGRLAQGSGLGASGSSISSLCFLNGWSGTFPFSRTLSSLALPSLAATTGPAAATTGPAAAPFVTSSPSLLPATSASSRYACPLLFPSAVRDGAPQTLTRLFVLGSESSYNILPTNFDFVCENYRVYFLWGEWIFFDLYRVIGRIQCI